MSDKDRENKRSIEKEQQQHNAFEHFFCYELVNINNIYNNIGLVSMTRNVT